MSKKSVRIVVIILLALTGSTCKKKISKYPFEMEGVWFSESSYTSNGTVLVIEKSGEGKIFSFSTYNSQSSGLDINKKGKVKFKKDILYIGTKKFDIFNKPVEVLDQDSIEAPDGSDFTSGRTKVYKVLARMTLQEKGLVSFHDTYTFCKYLDY